MEEEIKLTPYQIGALKRKGKKHRKHRHRRKKRGYRKVKRNHKKRKYYFKKDSLKNRGIHVKDYYSYLYQNETIDYISKLYYYESEEDKWERWFRYYLKV